MERVINIDNRTFFKLKHECIDYICEQDEPDEISGYIQDIVECNTLEDLVYSGVFHDACGEVLHFDEEKIVLTTEY